MGNFKKIQAKKLQIFYNMPFRGGGQAGGGKKGSNMKFHKPAEPAFLKRFKEKVGYREHVTTIDDKFGGDAGRQTELEDRDDRDDEKPIVVVLADVILQQQKLNMNKKFKMRPHLLRVRKLYLKIP